MFQFKSIFLWAAAGVLLAGCAGSRQAVLMGDLEEAAQAVYRSQSPADAVSALPDFAGTISLSDCRSYAAMQNPALKAAFFHWKAALEALTPAGTLPDPRFNFGYYIRAVETRVGPQEQMAGIAQTFPWFGKLRLQKGIAAEVAVAAGARFENQRRQLFYDVDRAYAEYWYLQQAAAVLRENLELANSLETVALVKYRAGKARHSDLMDVQIEVARLQDRLSRLEVQQRHMRTRLNSLLNRPPAAELALLEVLPEDTLQVDLDTLSAHLKKAHPELAEVRAESERERLQIRLARKAYYPDITLGVDYINTGNALMAGTPDDSKDPLIARLSINLPLWRGAYAGKVKAAEAAYATQLQVQQVRENELLARLEVAYYSYRDNLRQEQLYRNTLLPRAEDAYAVLETLFATGSAPFSELIASYQRKLEFSLTLQRIRTDRFTRLAELGYLCGDEVVGWGD